MEIRINEADIPDLEEDPETVKPTLAIVTKMVVAAVPTTPESAANFDAVVEALPVTAAAEKPPTSSLFG